MVIGICGLISSGKDTIADYLIKEHNFEKISFADKLKDSVAAMFDWDRELLDGKTAESRVWREKADPYWTNEMGVDITPRLVLQKFGTECMRNGFYDGIWVSLTKKKILDNPDKNYVIPDTRFPNEAKMLYEINGEVGLIPINMVKISRTDAKQQLSLLEKLEEHEDIQKVYSNFDLDESEMDYLV